MTIELWKSRFKLEKWDIKPVRIRPEQVTYPEYIPDSKRFFIGICKSNIENQALLIHDRDLTEEDIVHELTHLKHPKWSESKVNSFVYFIMNYYQELKRDE